MASILAGTACQAAVTAEWWIEFVTRGIHGFPTFTVSVEAYVSLQDGMEHAVVARRQSKAIPRRNFE